MIVHHNHCTSYMYCICIVMSTFSNLLVRVSNLFEVVETIHHWGLSGRKLREDIKQLEHHILVVMDDGQMEYPMEGNEGKEKSYLLVLYNYITVCVEHLSLKNGFCLNHWKVEIYMWKLSNIN